MLVPLTALGAVLIVFVPRWRRLFGPLLAAFAVVSAVGMQLATMSGEYLEDRIDTNEAVERHIDLATTARPLVFAFSALVVALVAVSWWLDRRSSTTGSTESTGSTETTGGTAARATHPAVLALGALVEVGAILATVWTVRAGHQGSDAVWRGTGESIGGG